MQQKNHLPILQAIFDRSCQNTELSSTKVLRLIYSNCAACVMIFLLHRTKLGDDRSSPVWRDNPILILGW